GKSFSGQGQQHQRPGQSVRRRQESPGFPDKPESGPEFRSPPSSHRGPSNEGVLRPSAFRGRLGPMPAPSVGWQTARVLELPTYGLVLASRAENLRSVWEKAGYVLSAAARAPDKPPGLCRSPGRWRVPEASAPPCREVL